MLDRLPRGAHVFLDANIFLYHVLEGRPSCAALFRRAQAKEIHAITSAIVLAEVAHRLMLAEIVQRCSLASSRGARNLLRRRPEHVALCTATNHFLHQVRRLGVRVLPLGWRELAMVPDLSRRYRLLTNDALIVATMTRYRLTHLASNDADFERVHDLMIWKP